MEGKGWIFVAEMWGVYKASIETEPFFEFPRRRLKTLVSWQHCCRIKMSQEKAFKNNNDKKRLRFGTMGCCLGVCVLYGSPHTNLWSCSDTDRVFSKSGGTKRYNTTQCDFGLWWRAQLTGRPPVCGDNDVDSCEDCTSATHLHQIYFSEPTCTRHCPPFATHWVHRRLLINNPAERLWNKRPPSDGTSDSM